MLETKKPLSAVQFDHARQDALDACAVMDTGRESSFDNIIFTGAQLLRVPTFHLALVGSDRIWMKASAGPALVTEDRAAAFCLAVVGQGELMVVANLLEDPRFGARPPPSDDTSVRFAAGIPVLGPGGHRIGCLCALDVRPRTLSPRQVMSLQLLAAQAGDLLQLRAPLPGAALVRA